MTVQKGPDRSRPLVSVIMATYNCADTVDESIQSILDQTYPEWELIICDDGSSDDTVSRLRIWKDSLGPRMTLLINPRNMRLQHSLNRCLKAARGELIARMDGDDISLPERLEAQVHLLMREPGLALVGTHMQRFDSQGLGDVVHTPPRPDINTLMRAVPFAHATVVARRQVFDDLRGYDERPAVDRVEDIDLWFRFFAAGLRGENLPRPLYLVREDISAIKRRTFRNRWNLLMVTLRGYRVARFPVTAYWRPVLSFAKVVIPAPVMLRYRRHQRTRWARAVHRR